MATFYLPSSVGGYDTTNQYIKYRIKVVEGTLSGRVRPVTVSVLFYRTNDYETQRGGTVYCKIAGTEYSQSFTDTSDNVISLNSNTVLFSKTVNITYTDAGTASVDISAKWQTNDGSNDYSSEHQGGTVTLTAIAKATYKVSYDANGGTGAPSAGTKTYGVDFTLSDVIPTRTGYTFVCWNTKQDGSGTDKNPEGIYYSNASVTFYAQWEENVLNVNYYSNGADYVKVSSANTLLNEVEKGKNVLVCAGTYRYSSSYSPYGLHDFTWDGASIYMTYTGHDYAKHAREEDGVIDDGWWGTSENGGILVHQGTAFATGQALAQALGLDISSESKTVDLYAQWELAAFAFVRESGVWVPATVYARTADGWEVCKAVALLR